MTKIRIFCNTILTGLGTWLSAMFGGYDEIFKTLLFCIIVDMLLGWLVAISHKSPKTESGGLSSSVNFEGIIKKILILVCVMIGTRFDVLLSVEYVRTAVCICFIINETLSIIENIGLMGVKMPNVIVKALDILKGKVNENV